VDDKKCAACLICVRECPFGVPFINADGYSEIDPAKCHGCGVCAAACPAKAIQLMQYEDDQISAKLDGLLERIL
jgi:heterodisulfide reductase subunit A